MDRKTTKHMNYDVQQLKTKAECDEVLAQVQDLKDSIDHEKIDEVWDQKVDGKKSIKLDDQIAEVNGNILAATAALATMQPGKAKNNKQNDLTGLGVTLYKLNASKGLHGSVAKIMSQVTEARYASDLVEFDTVRAAVTAHKDTLPA